MLDERLDLILEYFYNEHSYVPLKFELVVTSDPYSRRLELAMDEKDRAEVVKSRKFIETLNGTVALPQKLQTVESALLFVGLSEKVSALPNGIYACIGKEFSQDGVLLGFNPLASVR